EQRQADRHAARRPAAALDPFRDPGAGHAPPADRPPGRVRAARRLRGPRPGRRPRLPGPRRRPVGLRREPGRRRPDRAPGLDVAEQVYYARAPRLGGQADVRLLGPGRQPVLLATPERVLIACESELGHIHAYDTAGTDWRRNVPLTVNNPWLTSDECHSPQLT